MLLKDLESWFVCDEQFFFVLLARGGVLSILVRSGAVDCLSSLPPEHGSGN